MRKLAKQILIVGLLALPVATWFFFKPIRVLAPALAGVTCAANDICIDDPARRGEAILLKNSAVLFVQTHVGNMQKIPRMIFCSTSRCSKNFGFTNNAAYNVGTYGLVISPRGWQAFYLRHELIHHLQNERLGSMNAWLFKPTWFTEGMAYSLSEDPRHPLTPQLEGYRVQFEQWFNRIDKAKVWQEAALLR